MNEDIALFLEKISTYYNYSLSDGDKGRAIAFRKASNSIRDSNLTITSGKYAKDNIDNIAKSISIEIDSFLKKGTSARLKKLEKKYIDQKKVLDKFMKIYGVGPVSASIYYNEGLRTYKDLKNSGYLSNIQLEYLEHINSISKKIDRNEIESVENYIKDIVSFDFILAGSYRRKEESSSDYDMIIQIKKGLTMSKILDELKDLLYLKLNNGKKVFHGILKYSYQEEDRYRHIDISLVPSKTYYCFLLHATGPKELNIALSSRAQELGYHLNKYFLSYDNDRNQVFKIKSENDIFKLLRVKYLEPSQRKRKFKLEYY